MEIASWHTDVITEEIVLRNGREWKVEDVKMSDLAWNESTKENSREHDERCDEGLIPDNLQRIEEGVVNGYSMAYLVGYYNEKGRFVVLGGIHRIHVFRSKKVSHFKAYVLQDVVDGDPLLSQLRYDLNRGNGANNPLSADESQAIKEALAGGDLDAISKNRNVDKSILKQAIQSEKARRIILAVNKNVRVDLLSDDQLKSLYKLRHNGKVQTAAALAVIRCKIGPTDTRILAGKIQKGIGEAAQLQVIKTWCHQYFQPQQVTDTQNPVNPPPTPRYRPSAAYLRGLERVWAFLEPYGVTRRTHVTTQPEKLQEKETSRAIIRKLKELMLRHKATK